MHAHRPHPREELNSGPETTPRVAASVIVLRDSESGPEVLLVQRNPDARFMGGAWVFPGGAVSGEESPERAGLRELEEEAGIALPDGERDLAAFSRWITPAEVKVRFDTFFYVARAPAGAEPRVDGQECVEVTWLRPADALAAGKRGELQLVFPTIKHLEQLAELPTVAAVIELALSRTVEPVQPRIVLGDGDARVLLPGEPGFDA